MSRKKLKEKEGPSMDEFLKKLGDATSGGASEPPPPPPPPPAD